MDEADKELRDLLLEMYYTEKLNLREIAERMDVTESRVLRNFENLGIKRRTNRQAKLLQWKKELGRK